MSIQKYAKSYLHDYEISKKKAFRSAKKRFKKEHRHDKGGLKKSKQWFSTGLQFKLVDECSIDVAERGSDIGFFFFNVKKGRI